MAGRLESCRSIIFIVADLLPLLKNVRLWNKDISEIIVNAKFWLIGVYMK